MSGHVLNRRLSELGADRFHPRGEADDRTGNQEVQPWLAALRASLAAAAAAAANGGNGGRSTTANGTNGTNGANNGANNSNGSNGARSAEPDPDAGAGPEKPLLARIVAARWLTASTESPTAGGRAGWQSGAAATAAAAVRRVLHLELDVSALPAGCALEPGDALAVVPQNDPTDVKELLPQLGVRAKQADTPLQLPDGFDAPMHLGGERTTALLSKSSFARGRCPLNLSAHQASSLRAPRCSSASTSARPRRGPRRRCCGCCSSTASPPPASHHPSVSVRAGQPLDPHSSRRRAGQCGRPAARARAARHRAGCSAAHAREGRCRELTRGVRARCRPRAATRLLRARRTRAW